MKAYTVLSLIAVSFLIFSVTNGVSNKAFSLPPGINATSTTFVNVTNTVTQSSSSLSTTDVQYTFKYGGSGTINVTIPGYASDISLALNGQPYTFSQTSGVQCSAFTQTTSFNCVVLEIRGVQSNDAFVLSYSYSTAFQAGSDTFNSTFVLIPSSQTELKVTTVLPQGAFLPPTRYSAPASGVFSTNGQNIEITWSIFQNTPGLVLPFTVSYQATFPAQSNYNSYILGIIIIAGIIIVLWSIRHSKEQLKVSGNKKKANPFKSILNSDEKKVLNMMRRGKFIAQNELIVSTGYSKAKISKIISKLSRYKLIKIQIEGKYNKIKKL